MDNQLIIFSKNRACQLHLLLESIYECSFDMFDSITVLYKADGEYQVGYDLLIERFCGWVNFKKEETFVVDTLALISDDYEYTTFLVDDVVFFEKIDTNLEDVINYTNDKLALCFSLRIGLNSTYSHPANMHYKIGDHEVNGDLMNLNFNLQKGDLGYPLSVDGHIFKTSTIKRLISKTAFNNPNTLEANLQQYMRFGLPSNIMCSFAQSKMVSVPVNLVNNTYNNRHGIEFYISEKELNVSYLNNNVISYSDLDFSGINGPHKELEYKFKEYVTELK